MSDYVYGLHEFVPEHEDEISFKVGDRIEIIEKDDEFGDGWWRGRNPSGREGLFPQSYTSSNPPADVAVAPPESTNGKSDGEMMRKTMTDVQEAIEALGGQDADSRSFSFASSQGDSEAEAEDDTRTDFSGARDARQLLAQRAQQANEERWAREHGDAEPGTPLRTSAPPIDVEMSDESADEDEDEEERIQATPRRTSGLSRQQPRIAEEDEASVAAAEQDLPPPTITVHDHGPPTKRKDSVGSGDIVPSEEFIVPSPHADEYGLPTARPERMEFPEPSPAPSTITLPTHDEDEPPLSGGLARLQQTLSAPNTPAQPEHASDAQDPEPEDEELVAMPVPVHTLSAPSLTSTTISTPATVTPTPSATRVGHDLPFASTSALPSPAASTFASPGINQALSPTTSTFPRSNGAASPQSVAALSGARTPMSNPAEWTVDEVVEWLQSKGFDQDVCDKFIEQEITGDVLLELDATVLKSEIGIAAFGKRIRIVNAVAELRRAPSPVALRTPQSQGRSLPYAHSHSASTQSWAQSPAVAPGFSPAMSGVGSVTSVETPYTTDLPSPTKVSWRSSADAPPPLPERPEEVAGESGGEERALAGLGLAAFPTPPATVNGKEVRNRPAQLMLSPSDGALSVRAVGDDAASEAAEDQTVVSDTELSKQSSTKSKRRHLFGRSTDSASIKEKSSPKDTSSRTSKDHASPQPTPSTDGSPTEPKDDAAEVPPTRRHKGRKSVDDRKSSDRLSLFGSLPGVGKSRKPPPKIQAAKDDSDKMSTFSRLRERRTSGRPSTSDGTKREKDTAKPSVKEAFPAISETTASVTSDDVSTLSPKKDTVLRKRTQSTPDNAPRPAPTAMQGTGGLAPAPTLKPGKSILEQIGTPDHNGWLRKKGDRYNSWKVRYLVLKGSHLYWLRSNSNSETKIKGYINIVGYRVVADENIDPGRYAFKIVHDSDKAHFFSSDEQLVVREWMKALMKATISRDYTSPVVSSSNVPTISLTVAQAMNPPPRPPSPTAREATQKALRRENPNQLSSRDAQILLMGMPDKGKDTAQRGRLDSFFTNDTVSTNGGEPPSPLLSTAGKRATPSPTPKSLVPPRPTRRGSSQNSEPPLDIGLMDWANSHLPTNLHINDPNGKLYGGLALLRIAESIKGKPSAPPVPDSAFPSGPNDDKLDGLFRLFDFLLDNDVKMGSVSINDIRQGKREKVVQLLKSMKVWDDKRKAVAGSVMGKTSPSLSSFR